MSVLSSAAALPGRYVAFATSPVIIREKMNPFKLTNRQGLVLGGLMTALHFSPLNEKINDASCRLAQPLMSKSDDEISWPTFARDMAVTLTVGFGISFAVLAVMAAVAKKVA